MSLYLPWWNNRWDIRLKNPGILPSRFFQQNNENGVLSQFRNFEEKVYFISLDIIKIIQ